MASAGGSVAAPSKVLKGPRACATCAKAKSRCIAGPRGQEKCERCHRLRKPCSSQTPAPSRKRKEPKPTRVAELERRLEDLTARIESVQRQGPAVPSPPDSDLYRGQSRSPSDLANSVVSFLPQNLVENRDAVPSFGQCHWPDPLEHIFPNRSMFEAQSMPDRRQPTTDSGVSPAPGAAPPQPSSGDPSARTTAIDCVGSSPYQQSCTQQSVCPWPQGDEAEALLQVYRERMAHLFPFAVAPPHLSSAELREQRPFFWKVAMVGACRLDGQRQIVLGTELLREVTEAAFLKPQKNIDLLHGLQMLIAWYHYNLSSFQMMNLLFLARSITTSLGTVDTGEMATKGGCGSGSLEQMRAFAGTYYLITMTFTTNKLPDALMNNVNTSYLASCCRALLSQMEYPTDELVVHLVRAQQLLHSISQGFARLKASSSENRLSQANFIHDMLERIRGIASGLPPHIGANPTLRGHFLVAEILVYENSLEELYQCPFTCQSSEPASMGLLSAPTTEELPEPVAMLWECARVVHTFMEHRLPDDKAKDFPRLISPTFPDLTYVFLTMLKLATLQVPGWDLARARKELQSDKFMTRLMKRMEQTTDRRRRDAKGGVANNGLKNGQQSDDTENTFAKLARKIRNVRDLLRANEVDSDYAISQVARVCDPPPMTLADAAQDLMQDLGGGLWQDLTSASPEWNAFIVNEAVDWAAIFKGYTMTESMYTA
ncbi:hypothetical protein C7999DRAFT_40971 [Corynascus novoguineensis]|uniref:Zn(2)-C6 fungal-type domain-containing protein n=1 Tax=Corynascus novoguineensis TaxID=1126955 RepID=A0AAN7CSX7_9PEZI|nr:hypothetical protein C7999DRAFT_40971 [Corynascus novoguineensis]